MKNLRAFSLVIITLFLAALSGSVSFAESNAEMVQDVVSDMVVRRDIQVDTLAKSGAICWQFGHWWEEDLPTLAQYKREEVWAIRRCKLCEEVEVKTHGWHKQ